MREVDDHWPAVGARLHHSVGTWPLLLDDTTEVVESVPGSLLRAARPRPADRARPRCTIRLERSGAETEVVIEEDAIPGPGQLVPKLLRTRRLTGATSRRCAAWPTWPSAAPPASR